MFVKNSFQLEEFYLYIYQKINSEQKMMRGTKWNTFYIVITVILNDIPQKIFVNSYWNLPEVKNNYWVDNTTQWKSFKQFFKIVSSYLLLISRLLINYGIMHLRWFYDNGNKHTVSLVHCIIHGQKQDITINRQKMSPFLHLLLLLLTLSHHLSNLSIYLSSD